jgi:hypothetical protein
MVGFPRHGLWYVAGGCVVSLSIVVVVLFLLPASVPPQPVTIESIDWQIEQTPPSNGTPEFSELWINQSGPTWGYPLDVRAGGTFNDSLVIVNDELYDVFLCSASISPPLRIVTSFPPLPMVAIRAEDNLLTLTIAVDADPGTAVNESGAIDAVDCGTPS